jgi:azurin
MRSIVPGTLALILAAALLPPPLAAQQPRTINLVGTDTLTYSLPAISAKPGEVLQVVLRTMSMQPKTQLAHNFVLLRPAADVNAFITAASRAKQAEYVPADFKPHVIVATSMAGAGETVRATFKAPAKAGTSPYVCSYPGHFGGGMKGTLIVKP